MADLEKKSFNFDKLFKMAHQDSVPNTPCLFTTNKRLIHKPKPTSSMLIYNNGLSEGECVVDECLLSIHGWLTPDGELFSCRWQQHTKAVNFFGFDTERDAIVAGYIKLSNMKWQLGRQYRHSSVTEAQIKTIDLWHERNKLSREYFLNDLGKKGKE